MKNDRLFARAIESERVLDTRDKRKMIGGHFPNRRIESGRGIEILSNCDRNSSREEIPTRKRERKEGKIRNGGRFGERRVFALRGEASEIISTAR